MGSRALPPVHAAWQLLQRSLFDEPDVAVDAPRERLHGEVFRHPRAQRDVCLDGHLVAYEMRRARRRSIGFVVGPEGLSVSAPRWVGAKELDSALQDKRGWILRKLREQRERALRLESARIDWRDGARLPFLGGTVVVRLDARATGAMLTPADDAMGCGTLRVGLPTPATPEQIRDVVQSWLQRQARRIFEERCALYAPRLQVQVRRIGLSSAATRWGSANADGSIRLNWRLVHFGMAVIDYVVAHELAHLREMNHSPAFWDVVRSVLPDYEHARAALRDGQVPILD
ncbi:MAG TPA: SprT family zinc-dependent metalloprotease [Rubrivivax sp.]|nr:SprT family zinc-dependent metalloprotease [Rubrivivax sp.]